MKINDALEQSKKILMEYWPLQGFIATNPLWALRHKDFHTIVDNQYINGVMDINYYKACYREKKIINDDVREAIYQLENIQLNDSELTRWIARSFTKNGKRKNNTILISENITEYRFQKPAVWIKENMFSVLRDYFSLADRYDGDLLTFWMSRCDIQNNNLKKILSLPLDNAIDSILCFLEVPEVAMVDYLQAIYRSIYGWSSFMNWRNNHPNNPWVSGSDPCEVILLMWLAYEYLIACKEDIRFTVQSNDIFVKNSSENMFELYVWQTAFELHYSKHLLSQINNDYSKTKDTWDAQFIFCIDTRSEGMRRHIEARGNYQTFGFAGFFGAIFKLKNDNDISYQAPALVEAQKTFSIDAQKSFLFSIKSNVKKVIKNTKKQMFSSFALFEIIGFWFSFFMLFKIFQPYIKFKPRKNKIAISQNYTSDEQFNAAYNLLINIGLIHNFSKTIIICAHQSDNINNPFKATLDCGACGGNSGIPNAIVMADILNDAAVRSQLKKKNIDIPSSTKFIPACHHTTYDRLEIINGTIAKSIENDIDAAAKALREEKVRVLPGSSGLRQREKNWSELVPELGLINNAALIIGPRQLTLGKNLNRRVFLHSYCPELDEAGDILAGILSAPAIVAHWISAQYYFSTIDPNLFGAGNKAIHNVLPGIGVLEGNLSDLKIGLPQQSTHFQSTLIHEPRRLVVIVYAYKRVLDLAIERSPDFKTLLENHWISLRHVEVE